MDLEWQAKRAKLNDNIAQLKKNNAPHQEIVRAEEQYALRDSEHSAKLSKFLKSSSRIGVVGAFEGAGYCSEGLFRPMLECTMFSKSAAGFCAVCQDTIKRVTRSYL